MDISQLLSPSGSRPEVTAVDARDANNETPRGLALDPDNGSPARPRSRTAVPVHPPSSPVSSHSTMTFATQTTTRHGNSVAMGAPSRMAGEAALARSLPPLRLGAPLTALPLPAAHVQDPHRLVTLPYPTQGRPGSSRVDGKEHSAPMQSRPHGATTGHPQVNGFLHRLPPSNQALSHAHLPLSRLHGSDTRENAASASAVGDANAPPTEPSPTQNYAHPPRPLEPSNIARTAATAGVYGALQAQDTMLPPTGIQTVGLDGSGMLNAGSNSQPAVTAAAGSSTKPFRCTEPGCEAVFGQKGSLTRHLKNRHSSNCRPHACDLCPKTFSEKWTLNVHRRNVHLKLKAHHCPHCSKSFGEKWNLRKHVNVVHLQVKPFSCPICNRAFGYKGDMVKHVAELHSTSSTLRPYVCEVEGCGVKFARMRYLRRHQNLTHKDMALSRARDVPGASLTIQKRGAQGMRQGLAPTNGESGERIRMQGVVRSTVNDRHESKPSVADTDLDDEGDDDDDDDDDAPTTNEGVDGVESDMLSATTPDMLRAVGVALSPMNLPPSAGSAHVRGQSSHTRMHAGLDAAIARRGVPESSSLAFFADVASSGPGADASMPSGTVLR